MPREVIMPALGMAQETGLIVAWLKQPGDAVRAGEALMEVETDKAVMEVEAQADGFLTDVRAAAGENVPVGQVVAVIADTADAPHADPSPASAPAVGGDAALPAGQRIIMPALGMAQDTGLIVAWHKSPGDVVTADDVLLEVETDKSTMEVPAGHDGFIAALLAEAGQAVPVGEVIAVISASKPVAAIQQRAAMPKAPAPAPQAARSLQTAARQHDKPQNTGANTVHATNGRILASPKARRLAFEQALDLGVLVAAGHPQPYHVADLAALRDLMDKGPGAAPGAAMPVAAQQINARVTQGAVADFRDWMRSETGAAAPISALFASFAGAALRQATHPDGSIVIEVTSLAAGHIRLADPDRVTLAQMPADAGDAPANLILRDLTDSAITSLTFGVSDTPVLTVTRDADVFVVTLDFASHHMPDDAAIAFVTGFAARLTDPLHHLL
ncbi:MAG: biotin/lipoyl-containing protein [Pseudorhodobacter sp.]|nr:biotin/lipoyl-containing protein [Pseudorhodobacter sp.]